ncbi:hypothetical protein LCGC14_1842130 [marine sediment metagenome]|uniref:Uncharacterized protein n=1 Tax=marine sediment metagenome TaxID=412755 RepID=A0A0F9ISG1_9ZZZZ
MKSRLSSKWFTNYRQDEEEATKYEERLLSSTELFASLRTILDSFKRDSKAREDKLENPNWGDLLKRENGYQKALEDLYQILPKEE